MAIKVNLDKVMQQDLANEARKTRGGDFPSTKFFKFVGNKVTLRILPPWTEEGSLAGQFWREVHLHWKVSEDQRGPVLCTRNTPFVAGEDDCPICAFVDQLKGSGDPAAVEVAKEVRAKPTFYFSVIDMADKVYTEDDVEQWKAERPDKDVPFEEGDPKIQVYTAPRSVFNAIIKNAREGLDIADLETGCSVTISRTGKGINTEYTVTPVYAEVKKPKALHVPDDQIVNLEQVGYTMPVADMKELLSNGVGGDFPELMLGMGVQKEEEVATKKPKKALAAPAKDEEEVDDDDLLSGDDGALADLEAELDDLN